MNNLDTRTHDPKTFHASDYATACQNGTCTCAPICQVCGKAKCWDMKLFPGHHDWRCGECCQHSVTTVWKRA
jgi:hypothetical protein